jgi:nucleotide-binding universal stress UspA family protein
MFKKILFATSASPACDHAARVAFEMAQKYDAKLVAFHVLGVPTRGFSQVVVDIRTGEEVTVDQEYISWVKEEMKNTYARQLERCGTCEMEVRVGLPHREVLRYAREEDVDIIIMGASTRSEDPDAPHRMGFAGSTFQKVAKAARCPVLTVARPAASFWGGFSSVVFGTDFSKASDSAFQFALNFAKKQDTELHIFHALDLSGMHAGRVLSQEEIEDKLMEARNRMRSKYLPQLEGFDKFEMEVWEGLPYMEIVKYVRESQSDLLVMAHHTREADPEKAMLGSTMEQVILRANCPVVSVNHPDKVKLD